MSTGSRFLWTRRLPPVKTEEFGVFIRDNQEVRWKQFCHDFENAKGRAKEITATEGVESFVFDLTDSSEVATFFPQRKAIVESMDG
jgi:hypothetical protein